MKSVSAKHVRNHYGLNLLDVAGFSVTYPLPPPVPLCEAACALLFMVYDIIKSSS